MRNREEGDIVICTEKPESQNFYLLILFKHISRVFFLAFTILMGAPKYEYGWGVELEVFP